MLTNKLRVVLLIVVFIILEVGNILLDILLSEYTRVPIVTVLSIAGSLCMFIVGYFLGKNGHGTKNNTTLHQQGMHVSEPDV